MATTSSSILRRLGRTLGKHGRGVSSTMVFHLSHGFYPTKTGTVASEERARSNEEIMVGAKLAQVCTYLVTKTFEARPLLPAVLVAEGWALQGPSHRLKWILRLPSTPSLTEDRDAAERLAQLADGRTSIVVTDTVGRARGVADISGAELELLPLHVGGYGFVADRHRMIKFICSCSRTVCHYDGFQWRKGRSSGSLDQIIEQIFNPWLPTGEGSEKAMSLLTMIEEFSYLRLSTILAICYEDSFYQLRQEQRIQALRPELEDAQWPCYDSLPRGLHALLRLDGAHFLTEDLRVLSVCNKILLNAPSRSSEPGTGKGAAKTLSAWLGMDGIVIKVSADGPVAVFRNGRLLSM